MRKDDDLHDEKGEHRTVPRAGMTQARFEHEMRRHMEGDHLFWKYITNLIRSVTTEESRDDGNPSVSSPRKAP